MQDIFDRAAVRKLILQTGRQELLPRAMRVQSSEKADGSLITEADTIAHDILSRALQQISGYPVLSEELDPQTQTEIMRIEGAWWCVDPLDGTSNFAAGIGYYAISVALVINNIVKFAAVYDPTRDEYFQAISGCGASLNGRPLDCAIQQRELPKAIGLIDFKRLPDSLASTLVLRSPWASQRSFGASALDWCQLAAGRCHIYLHGKQMPWDYAAGKLILEEAGGVGSNWSGRQPDVSKNLPEQVLAAVSPAGYRQWFEHLQRIDPKDFNSDRLSLATA